MKCQISLGYGDLNRAGKDSYEAWQTIKAMPSPTTVVLFHVFSHKMRADRVALFHCCSAYIVTLSKEYAWSHTDGPNLRRRVSKKDKEYKSYGISKLNIEHLLLVERHKASQKRLKIFECAFSVQ